MSDKNNNRGLIVELAHRGVFQAVAIYVAVAWGGTEILITASDRFGWPGWIADAAVILFLTGFPFVVLLAWTFDLSGSRLQRVDPGSMRGKLLIASAATVVMAFTATVVVLRDGRPDVAGEPVIAVLPMQDFTGEDGGAVLALSFTGELIHRISAHPDLMALDLRTVTNPAVATVGAAGATGQLGADYYVQGSLNQARGGTLIRARMTDTAGGVLWEDESVRDLGNAIEARTVQAEIAGEIAAALGKTLTGVDYCEPSANSEAVAFYYEGWRQFNRRGKKAIAAAARAFESAVEHDPDYARALADLADVYLRFGFWLVEDPSPYFESREDFETFMDSNGERVRELAERALARCPNLGTAYFNHESVQQVKLSSVDKRAIDDEALRRESDNVTLLNAAINLVQAYGHVDIALAYAERGLRKDPLNPRAPHVLRGVLFSQGDIEGAIEMEIRARDLGYNPGIANFFLAFLYTAAGDSHALEAHMAEHAPDGFEPVPLMPIDPRRILAARDDPQLLSELIAEFDVVLPDLDGTNTDRHLRWAKLLDDEALVWRYLEHFAGGPRERGDAWTASQIWDIAWRQRLANDRLLDLMGWREEFGQYWDAYGPPDDCDWDGISLTCDGV
ncbi:MAG: tetratricopeptide repeat protein [Gammaproteobacteria bacterium]